MNEEDIKESSSSDKESSNKELEACKKKCDEYLDGWKRAKADFINYKKDEYARLQEIARYGTEELIVELITVLDSFELGIAAMEKAGQVEKGVYMIKAQVEDILKKRGLERIKIKKGDAFDPALHEAIKEVESEEKEGMIVEDIEAGYKLHEKVVRPARVKISKDK